MPTARVAVALAPHTDLEMRELEIVEPEGNEVLIRTVATGICHTDILLRDGLFGPPHPVVPGHEGVGVIDAVGPDVLNLAVGDHVVLTQNSCGRCVTCRSAHPMNCERYEQFNLSGRRPNSRPVFAGEDIGANFVGQSSFSSLILASENNACHVPKELRLDTAAPLGCGMVTGAGAVLNVLKPDIGSTLVIHGVGAVGMAAVMAARVADCATIIAVDLNESRLAIAKELGATHVVNAGQEPDVVAAVHDLTSGGADYAVDAVGAVPVVRNAIASTRAGGHTVVLGLDGLGKSVPIDLDLLVFNRKVQGAILGDQVAQSFIPHLVQLHLQGAFPFDRLVTRYAFDDINTAIADAVAGRAIKPVVTF
ncbi:NAD(P)-dependent alcohol dehydrogenase [Streptomyces sp. NPDC021098]|uniref:NAD(P)-dependent alcohol dehydrogenase n=1 Tax=unclassified Streptomyces TaxID=2593676 RepID=UPI0037B68107